MVLCDLVGVLAGSGDLDRARPVRVHVAEGVGRILQVSLLELIELIEAHVEVSGSHTSMSGCLIQQHNAVLWDTI